MATADKTGDRDLGLKLRIQAILWRLGYYTRIGVKLASAGDSASRGARSGARGQHRTPSLMELTDLDVLGIRFDPDYTTSYAVADCSTDKSRRPVARTFWLRGVMDYFHADRGYAVLSKECSQHEREVADELGITLLDEQGLQALEERYHSDQAPILVRVASDEAYEFLERNIHQVDSKLAPLLSYRDHRFWQNKPNRNLLNAISVVRKANVTLDPSQRFQRVLLLDVLSLFSVAFLQACGTIFRTGSDSIYTSLRSYLFGGSLAMQTREALVKDIESLISLVEPQMTLPEESLRRLSLEPEYLPSMADLAQRFISKPGEARNVPRYLEAIILEKALYDGPRLRDIFSGDYSEITLKFVHDLAHFFRMASGANPAMFQDLDKD